MFQIGFLEILLVFIIGIIFIGPNRIPELAKQFIKFRALFQSKVSSFKNDIERELNTDEIKKDIFNEMKLKELNSKDEENDRE